MNWLQLLINLVVTGLLLYVFQKIIDERSARRLEKFKIELQSATFENETKFSKLHERRMDIVAGLYMRLYRMQQALITLQTVFGYDAPQSVELSTSFDKTNTAMTDFENYYIANRLYVPAKLCKKPDNFYENSKSAEANFFGAQLNAIAIRNVIEPDEYKESFKQQLQNTSHVLSNMMTPLLQYIENEFRLLLESKQENE